MMLEGGHNVVKFVFPHFICLGPRRSRRKITDRTCALSSKADRTTVDYDKTFSCILEMIDIIYRYKVNLTSCPLPVPR